MSILGWSPGDDLEIFQREIAIDNFDLKNVLPNPAIFDTVKLLWMNGQYIRNLNNDEFSKKAVDNISTSLGREIFKEELERINLILEVVQERLETLNDIIHQVKFLLDEPFTVNVDEWNSVNSENVQSYLEIIRGKFKSMEDFNLENIENMMREQLKELNMKPKEGFQATRIAVTGTKISPPLFESIFALGKSATIARLAEMIENL
jgi:glutamyl/glutaminyl-tRNA synthetase